MTSVTSSTAFTPAWKSVALDDLRLDLSYPTSRLDRDRAKGILKKLG